MLLYCGSINVKLNAVTAGHNLKLFIIEVGTVLFIRSHTSGSESPESSDCMPKKYVLKIGVKQIWLTVTFVASERTFEE
jgi:hypothetical protein